LQNFGGAIPRKGTMAIFGPNRYCGSTFAEDEEGLPASWPTFGQDVGLARGANAVTVAPLESLDNQYMGTNFGTNGLDMVCKLMNAWNTGGTSVTGIGQARPLPTTTSTVTSPTPISGFILLPRAEVKVLVDLGMTKNDVKKYIWDRTHYTNNPGQLVIVTTGGDQGSHVYWMRSGMGRNNITRKIQLPAKWNDLLTQAERDLGIAPDQHPGAQ
jgi:hypothetical protein